MAKSFKAALPLMVVALQLGFGLSRRVAKRSADAVKMSQKEILDLAAKLTEEDTESLSKSCCCKRERCRREAQRRGDTFQHGKGRNVLCCTFKSKCGKWGGYNVPESDDLCRASDEFEDALIKGREHLHHQQEPTEPAKTFNGVPSDWMQGLSDTVLMKDLSIPGSHDVLTSYNGGKTQKLTICNDKTITELLDQGIRALDLRLRLEKELSVSLDVDGVNFENLVDKFATPYREELVDLTQPRTPHNVRVTSPLRLRNDVTIDDAFGEHGKVPGLPSVGSAVGAEIDISRSQWSTLSEAGKLDAPLAEQLHALSGTKKLQVSVSDIVQGRHGRTLGMSFEIDLLFAMEEIQKFLNKHPTEVILVMIKNEAKPSSRSSAKKFLQVVVPQLDKFSDVLHDWGQSVPSSPTLFGQVPLGNLRKKVVLINSDGEDFYKSFQQPLLAGKYLMKNIVYPSEGPMQVLEGNWKQKEVSEKMAIVSRFVSSFQGFQGETNSVFGVALNINPLGKSKMSGMFGPDVDVLANDVNAEFGKLISRMKLKHTGLTMMDYPGQSAGLALVKQILALNF